MPNARKRSERARKERAALLTSDLLHRPPMKSHTPEQFRTIRFTHIRIHPTFANASDMTVFEVYFAIKHGLMALSLYYHSFACLKMKVIYGVLIIVDCG